MAKIVLAVDGIDCEVELLDSVCISNVEISDGVLTAFVIGQRGKRYSHAVLMSGESAKKVLSQLNVCVQNLPLEV